MLTGDGHKANLKTFELLGCDLDVYDSSKPFFNHPTTGSPVFCMLDANFKSRNYVANWKDTVEIFRPPSQRK